ncbi:DUF6919 domain-containing protein [Streptomyces sp. S1D4-14]|uniref:DUF6919 domain-containing protein n=1 Tax=Streptomyces sp. S1D4-14 TaxID=2594461 RepID=UPI0011650D84|nr:hypothetical protein [Streptomyces sp. S1D4-14]QDN64493.1 hypothetical protein FNV66_01270 [Streptomyces sp. S1D4-14]
MDRIWRDARSIGDLGGAMAGWLEGHIDSQPGCSAGPDDETLPRVPVLARLNRRGFVTTDSQPGLDDVAFDGRPWTQRAAVQGYIAVGDPLLPRIIRAARAAGLIVTAHGAGRAVGPRRGVAATRWGSEPHTGFGGRSGRGWRRSALPGIGRRARRQMAREGVALAVIDPVWGRDDVLWSVLDQAIGYTTEEAVS